MLPPLFFVFQFCVCDTSVWYKKNPAAHFPVKPVDSVDGLPVFQDLGFVMGNHTLTLSPEEFMPVNFFQSKLESWGGGFSRGSGFHKKKNVS